MRPRNDNSAAFLAFAIKGHLDGKSSSELADEWMDLMGWNQPIPAQQEADEK
jgi:hypothetical protein